QSHIVLVVAFQIFSRTAQGVREHFRSPKYFSGNCSGVRIDNDFGGIKSVTFLRCVRPVHSIAVELARLSIRQKQMPDMIGLFSKTDSDVLPVRFRLIEEAKIDSRRVFRVDSEVDTGPSPCRSQGIR